MDQREVGYAAPSYGITDADRAKLDESIRKAAGIPSVASALVVVGLLWLMSRKRGR